ncbi:hypothetical protein C8T65DRAFT_81287 [Cerioporus squamosus]|nr:hypothetical protein C8T65DRAFT_81287 [Cerioporus squamosus]
MPRRSLSVGRANSAPSGSLEGGRPSMSESSLKCSTSAPAGQWSKFNMDIQHLGILIPDVQGGSARENGCGRTLFVCRSHVCAGGQLLLFCRTSALRTWMARSTVQDPKTRTSHPRHASRRASLNWPSLRPIRADALPYLAHIHVRRSLQHRQCSAVEHAGKTSSKINQKHSRSGGQNPQHAAAHGPRRTGKTCDWLEAEELRKKVGEEKSRWDRAKVAEVEACHDDGRWDARFEVSR